MTGHRRTLHETAAQALLEGYMETDVGIQNLAGGKRWVQELREGADQDNRDYLDCIGQYHGRDPDKPDTDPAQLAACITVHHRLMNPYMTAMVNINIGETPGPDVGRRENGAKLADLPEPFAAKVYLRQYDPGQGDGQVRWTGPIRAITSTGTNLINSGGEACRQKGSVLMMARTLPAWWVPLEIGYTKASKTLFHLLCNGGVARWAYGQEVIRVWRTLIRPETGL